MHTIIISNTQEQLVKNFTSNNEAISYLKEVKNVTLSYEDNEKIYIETSNGVSYEYFK